MSDLTLFIGDLVYYTGPPIMFPQNWRKIAVNNNGIINNDEIAIVLENNVFLKIADLYFQVSEIEIPRISYKYLIKVE